MSLNNIYYVDMKERFDEFSRQIPKNLLPLVVDANNVSLAFRKLRESSGSLSKGPDGSNIDTLDSYSHADLCQIVHDRIVQKIISPVRRTYIPKANSNKMRPLGIASIWDRLTQMCIKLVIEPIAEIKFVPSSYGFREQVSAHNALAKVKHYSGVGWNYVVNVDMKDYFGTIDPNILRRECYAIGVKDKYILNYIFRLVKCGYMEDGILYETEVGVPQGSILGPLLSNIYLHSTDVWIREQYECWHDISVAKFHHKNNKSRNFSKTTLKKGVHVRYADDMLIMCGSLDEATRWMIALCKHLEKRMKLIVNVDKSSIIDLTKESMIYLGHEFYYNLTDGLSAQRLPNKKSTEIVSKARGLLRDLRRKPTQSNIVRWNMFVKGLHNYYKGMTHFHESFVRLQWRIYKLFRRTVRRVAKRYKSVGCPHSKSVRDILDRWGYRSWGYGDINPMYFNFGFPIVELGWANWDSSMINHLKQRVNRVNPYDYGEKKNHKPFVTDSDLAYLVRSSQMMVNRSPRYRDFRVSKYNSVLGKSYISDNIVPITDYHCHHIKPYFKGGKDDWDNLCVLSSTEHRLLHSKNYALLLNGVTKKKFKDRINDLISQIH